MVSGMFRRSMTAIRTLVAIATFCAFPAAQGGPVRHGAYGSGALHRPVRASHRPRFRPPRGAAAQDAARLGALVGRDCHGQADMPRNDHEWVVMCRDGKTFVVQPAPGTAGGAPPTECSLAGTGPEPACFPE
jgi:hypothetical protein